MKIARVGNGREIEVPETWTEAEKMIHKAMDYHTGPGGNAAVMSACARVAYGMFGDRWMAADPTQALGYLMGMICQRKGRGLD